MSGVATAIAGGTIVGALVTSDASRQAAKSQAGAVSNAADLQWQQYLQNREDQTPWRQAGSTAIGQLSDLTSANGQLGPNSHFTYNDLYADPSYGFRLNQGMLALQRSAAAKGGLLSGGTLKGLTDYAQNAASQEYSNAYGRWNNDQTNTFNRLASIAGLGQTSTANSAQAGNQSMGNITNLLTQGANAQAAGIMGQANAYSGAINNGLNSWMQYQMMQKLAPTAPAAAVS
jgi:hypothetical protein